jgi:glycerophosphoryl diester phosphodiesterase
MAAPAWLTARPIAHRGLHDQSLGLIENTLSAARAAMARDFAIECDVQLSADGEAMVFHDATLDRLTQSSGPLAARRAGDLAQVALKGTAERIPTLASLLAALAGRVPLICEIKSAFDGDLRLTRRVLEVVRGAGGPVALKSFDPAIVAALRDLAPDLPRGIVGESRFDDPEWEMLGEDRRPLAQLLHYPLTRPDFLSWQVQDLQSAPPVLARHGLGLPVLAWTVRSGPDRALAEAGADQMIFEGFVPH